MTEEAEKVLFQDSEYRFKIDAKETLLKKFKGNLPAEFFEKMAFPYQ